MAETTINKNQTGSGIWTSDSLIAGNNISITQVQKPEIDANTVGLYHFNDSFKDEISGNNATPYNAAYFSYTTGKFGNAIYCNQNLSSVGYSKITLVNPASNTNSYTIDFWIYLNNSYANLGLYQNPGATSTLGLGFYTSDNSVRIQSGFNGGGDTIKIDSISDIVSYSWFHVAYSYDNTNNTIYLFINGKMVWSLSGGYAPLSISSIYMGAYQKEYFRLDEFRISNVVRWTSDFTPFTQPYQAAVGEPQYQVNNTLDISGKQDILTGATGYDASKTQVLKNVNGTLTWVDEA